MSLPKSCKSKSCYSKQYGCGLLYNCVIYTELQAEAEYDDWKDSPESDDYFKELKNKTN